MKSKVFIFWLATSLALALLAFPANAGAALDRIMAAKTIKVATDANWSPQSFINANNEMDGFDVDVAKDIAKRLGVKIEFVTPAWDIITAGKWVGRWDMHVGSMTPTKKRAEVLNFPGIYYFTPASVAVHKDSKATSIKDLDGKVIAATTASTYEAYLKHDLTIDAEGAPPFEYTLKTDQIKSYDSSNTALDDLRLGDGVRLDAVLASLPTFLEAQKNGYPIKIIGDPLYYEPLSVAIDLGDKEFSQKLTQLIADMHTDGTLNKLSVKWYGVDRTVAK